MRDSVSRIDPLSVFVQSNYLYSLTRHRKLLFLLVFSLYRIRKEEAEAHLAGGWPSIPDSDSDIVIVITLFLFTKHSLGASPSTTYRGLNVVNTHGIDRRQVATLCRMR